MESIKERGKYMGHDLDNQELRATRRLLGLEKKDNFISTDELIKSYEDLKANKNIIKCIEKDFFFNFMDRIIGEYNRQKQINEEHRKVNGELREKVKELEIDLTTVYMKGVEDGKDKYKQKIKDKIEELKDTLKHYDEYSKLNLLERVNIDLIDSKIEILEELLRESEEK